MKNIFAILVFQVGVNVIGIPEYHKIYTTKLISCIHVNKNKFTK